MRCLALLAAPLCLAAAPSWAQVGVSAALQSDDAYRGHSLSNRRPVVGLNLSYDHRSGLYAGGSVTAPVSHEADDEAGFVEYLGYVARLATGPALDLGVTDANVFGYKFPKHRVEYQELYAGLIGEHLSFHAHYSPNYFHTATQTLYTELDGTLRPTPDWRVFGHLGVLSPLAGVETRGSRKERYDFSAGVARVLPHAEINLSWVEIAPMTVLATGQPQDRAGLVLSLAYFF